jgi:hypothetical protein
MSDTPTDQTTHSASPHEHINPRTTSPLTVVCYARPSQFTEPIDTPIQTLTRLETEGAIETLLMRTWPAELSLAVDAPRDESLAAFEQFRAWADRAGVSICPPFEQIERTSTITGEHQDVLRTPLCCLACYIEDDLVAVYPHTDGEQTTSVTDAIARLRTDKRLEGLTVPARPESSSVGTCPECEAPCLSAQGIYVCLDCRWVAGTTPAGHYRGLPTLQTQWAERGDDQPTPLSETATRQKGHNAR